MKKTLILLVVLIALAGCNKGPQPINDGHNAQNSLDYLGVYKGILPCADCEGISTAVRLNANNTYERTISYLGVGKNMPKDTKRGDYAFDASGNIIILKGITDASGRYFVAENRLLSLDRAGKKIEGPLSEKYILNKQ